MFYNRTFSFNYVGATAQTKGLKVNILNYKVLFAGCGHYVWNAMGAIGLLFTGRFKRDVYVCCLCLHNSKVNHIF